MTAPAAARPAIRGYNMTDGSPDIFTIGHSNGSLEEFLALLRRHAVTAIADVRSQPYGWLDHFNRENLSAELKAGRIEYVFLGDQLGARRQERECYENGIALYERVATLPAFREGLAPSAVGSGEIPPGHPLRGEGTA